MAINFNTFFTRAGKIIDIVKVIDASRGTTISTEIEQALDLIDPTSADLTNEELSGVFASLTGELDSYRTSGNSKISAMANALIRLIVATVKQDEAQPSDSEADAIDELIRQMIEQVVTIQPNSMSATVTAGSENVGNGSLQISMLRGDGLENEYAIEETLNCTISSTSGGGSFSVDGEKSVGTQEYDWPQGSGSSDTVTMLLPSSSANKINNGDVETLDTVNTEIPSGWIKGDGAAAELVLMTDVDVQLLDFSGTLTTGSFVLELTDENGDVQRTGQLAYNASASTQQAAVSALTGFSGVTVAVGTPLTGITYAYTFTGIRNPGAMAAVKVSFERNEIQQLTKNAASPASGNFTLSYKGEVTGSLPWNVSASSVQTALQGLTNIGSGNVTATGTTLDSASIVISFVSGLGNRDVDTLLVTDVDMPSAQVPGITTTTGGRGLIVTPSIAATAHNYRGARAVQITGDGSSKGTFMLQKLTGLKPSTQYGFAVALKFGATGATGVMRFNLVDGVGGSIIKDSENRDNKIEINATAVSSSASALHTGFFRTPVNLPDIVYLEATLTVAISNIRTLYLDNFILAETSELYGGGPHAIGYAGNVKYIETDTITIGIGRGATGRMTSAFNRLLDLVSDDILMPSWSVLTFSNGNGTAMKSGDKIVGGTSGNIAYVRHIYVSGGTWGAGSAAGRIAISISTTFVAEQIATDPLTATADITAGQPQTHLDVTYLD